MKLKKGITVLLTLILIIVTMLGCESAVTEDITNSADSVSTDTVSTKQTANRPTFEPGNMPNGPAPDGVSGSTQSAADQAENSTGSLLVTSEQFTDRDLQQTIDMSKAIEANGDINTDAVVFSKSDITFNGSGKLVVVSSEGNGITSKDDLKITGGTYDITSKKDGLEANDSIRIYDGDIVI